MIACECAPETAARHLQDDLPQRTVRRCIMTKIILATFAVVLLAAAPASASPYKEGVRDYYSGI
jgi:hypothetical protein